MSFNRTVNQERCAAGGHTQRCSEIGHALRPIGIEQLQEQ
jgi:hypothetical protein